MTTADGRHRHGRGPGSRLRLPGDDGLRRGRRCRGMRGGRRPSGV